MELNMTLIAFFEITLDETINYQTELEILINKLNNDYKPRKPKKNKVLESARKSA